MIFKLDTFTTIAVLLIASWGGGGVAKAEVKPTPRPLPVIKLLAPIAPIAYKEMPTLDYQPFPIAPMGTYGNTYVPANCTWGVASMKNEVPQSWGNANTWDDSARAAGITVSDQPIVGTVAQTDHGYYGHVATVVAVAPGQVEITEMNYDYHGGVRTRWAAVSDFVYIYI